MDKEGDGLTKDVRYHEFPLAIPAVELDYQWG
jgi:hypothetical protein